MTLREALQDSLRDALDFHVGRSDTAAMRRSLEDTIATVVRGYVNGGCLPLSPCCYREVGLEHSLSPVYGRPGEYSVDFVPRCPCGKVCPGLFAGELG